MNEEKVMQAAESGEVSAMLELAEYYADKSKGGGLDDKVGDVISMEDFNKMLQSAKEDKGRDECESLAYKYYRMAAEAGNAQAMTEVARRLWDGIGVETNTEESEKWYRRGAEAGDPTAMRSAAYLSNSDEEKFKWFKLSAELPGLNELNKQNSIRLTAINYACGRGTAKDVAKAEEWLSKLDQEDANSAKIEISKITGEQTWLEQASASSPEAMLEMAESFVKKKNFVNALKCYKKVAGKKAQGTSSALAIAAMSLIGDIYYIGEEGIDQSYTEAYKWYEKAAAQDYNMAKIKCGLMLYRGLGVKKDLARAFEMFDEISWTQEKFFGPFRFNSVARYYAAKMSEKGEGCVKNPVDTFERYKVAGGLERIQPYESARRIPKAIYKVADAYFLGEGVRQNFAKARHFYEKTFSKGDGKTPYHREAVKKVMWMYELGEGIPQDKVKAAEWREKLGSEN